MSITSVSIPESSGKKKHNEHWSYDQALLLAQLAKENKDILKGKFSRSSISLTLYFQS